MLEPRRPSYAKEDAHECGTCQRERPNVPVTFYAWRCARDVDIELILSTVRSRPWF